MKPLLSFKRVLVSGLGPALLALIWSTPGRAQEPTGQVTSVEVHGTEVTITYDLHGEPDDEYEVRVYLVSRKRPDLTRELQLVRGHCGTGKFAGNARRILWNMREFPDIQEGESFVFRITVDRPGTPWYYWAGGGAVVSGIVTYLILKNKPDGPPKTAVVVPNPFPPGR